MRTLPILAGVAVLAFSGLVHGLWTDRWGRPEALEEALARVDRVPLQLGAWQGQAAAVDRDAFDRAGAQAYWARQYTHPRHKTTISVILMCGRAGRMSVHTPEVIYQGAGFEMRNAPVAYPISFGDGRTATFWTARFARPQGRGELRLCWAWNGGGDWEAPPSPRWSFRGRPFLYKLYVIDEGGRSPANASSPDDVLGDFFQHVLPVLQTTLFVEHRSG